MAVFVLIHQSPYRADLVCVKHEPTYWHDGGFLRPWCAATEKPVREAETTAILHSI